ncbi:MAG: VCBS repeat-containing protein, partial [Pyrinomonadaceae bacterium]|nr:VCBS repeat-containing protein [Pyrinomonadaceae bacterium]
MKKNLPKIILTLIFVGLLAIPIIVGRFYYQDTKPNVDKETSLKKYGFYFEEVAEKSGVKFVHSAPKLDAKLDHIMPQIASMGASVSVVDFNKDGFADLYFTNSGEDTLNALYQNNKDGTFTDVATILGVADVNKRETGVSMGAVWGDFDNDGFEDLFLYKWG